MDDRRALLIGLFKLLDVTGDGKIEQKEIKMVMMSIGEKVSNQEIDEMFRQFDKNNSGGIDQNEFVKAMMHHIGGIMPKECEISKIEAEGVERAKEVAMQKRRDKCALGTLYKGKHGKDLVKVTCV